MPTLPEAVAYVTSPATGEAELRRACEILELPREGAPAELRSRLRQHLDALDPMRPVVCLDPGPVAVFTRLPGPRLRRPESHERDPSHAAEIALVRDTADFAALLWEQLEVTRALVLTFGEAHASLRYAPGKWTVREAIGHLADVERMLSCGLLRLLREDSTPVIDLDPAPYVTAGLFEQRPLTDVLAEFAAVRAATMQLFHSAAPAAFERPLRFNGNVIKGIVLAYLIAGHERNHQQLLRTRYLPVLPSIEPLLTTASA